MGAERVRKEDVDSIAEILYKESLECGSIKEFKKYCKEWDKTDKYAIDLSSLTDDQIERVYKRYKYLYKR